MAALGVMIAGAAEASYLRWSVDVEDDPFEGKGRLTMMYMDSLNSGALIMCDEGSQTIVLRIATSFPYDQSSPPPADVDMSVIVDKGTRYDQPAKTTLLGTGNIGFDGEFFGEKARWLLGDLAKAKSKIYVKIGTMSPYAFSAKGSTNAAEKALSYCF